MSAEHEREVSDREEADHVERCIEHRQSELVPEQEQARDRPEEPHGEDRRAQSGACVERKPEPCVERRQDEDESIGLEHGKADGDDSERRQRDDEAGKPLVGPDGPTRTRCRRATSQPRTNADTRARTPKTGGLSKNAVYGASGSAAPVGRMPTRAPNRHEQAAECPYAEPRALRAQGGPERKSTPPTANDQIDDPERERDDAQYQRQTRGPATRRAIGEEEAVGRAKGSPDARVERADQRLGRAAELTEPFGRGRRAGNGRGGALHPSSA